MVGHTISTGRAQRVTTAKMNSRAEETLRRAERIAQSNLTYRQRRLLVESSAIPVSWCGSLWHLPRADLQSKAANTIVRALWGRRRQLRAKEIVLGVLHDPSRVDPASSLLYKRLADARRSLMRSKERLLYATHVNELLGDDDEPPVIGPIHGLRKAAYALGGRRKATANDLSITFDDAEPQIDMTTLPTKVWKRLVKGRISKMIITALDKRTVPKHSGRPANGRTRKDMHGIGPRVDHRATMSLARGLLTHLPKALDAHPLPDDPSRFCHELYLA